MSEKIRVGILFGGRSCEHEVSVTSARSVLDAIDQTKYDVTMIGISKQGQWLLPGDAKAVLEAGIVAGDDLLPVTMDYLADGAIVPRHGAAESLGSRSLDVVFPLLHGPYGEDGTVQGLLELADIAYVGSGVVGSAVGMDKEMAKRAFTAEGLAQCEYSVVRRTHWRNSRTDIVQQLERTFSYPLFVKPSNLGSSVGITKVHSSGELAPAIDFAADYDSKIIVEVAVENAHEVECAVLGNDDPQASTVGEIIPGNEFYDYETKYIDDNSRLVIPAAISDAAAATVQQIALRAFQAVGAMGLARVDFFVRREDDSVIINEINTMPGFTPISMYPKLWAASGLSYSRLIDRLIELALERHAEKRLTRNAL